MTRQEMAETLEWLIDCYEGNTTDKIIKFTLPIVLKESKEIIGWCGIGPLEFDESEIEVFFLISYEFWGRGFATEAVGALIEYSFDQLGLKRLVALVDPRNHASIRVVTKLGLWEEGIIRRLDVTHKHYEGHVKYALEKSKSG